jgi:hypothetical protein
MAIIVSTNATTYNSQKELGLKASSLTALTTAKLQAEPSATFGDAGYCDFLKSLGSNQFVSNNVSLAKPYYYNGGSIEIFNKTIPEVYALNPEYWKILNVYSKDTNSNTTVLLPSEIAAANGVRVYTEGETILPGQLFYFDPTDSKCYIYKSTDTDQNHIDHIVGFCILPAIDDKFLGVYGGAVNFDADTYVIGKNYYVDDSGYATATIPATPGTVKLPIGKGIDTKTIFLNIQEPKLL